MNLPPGDADVTTLSGGEKRRVALCKLLLREARPAAARRTDEPSRCRKRRLARAASRRVRRHGRRRDARSLLPRQRRQVDSGTRLRPRAFRSKATTRRGWSRSDAGSKSKRSKASARQKTLARELEWVRTSAKARQAKSKARIQAYETMAAEQFEDRPDELEIQIPPGPRLGDMVVEATNLGKSYGDRVIFENVNFRLPPAASSASSAPTAPARRRCSACSWARKSRTRAS